jgi:PKD repeat protein
MEALGRRFALFGLAFAFVASAEGATYLPISDAELAGRTPVIVRAQVLDISVGLETLFGSQRPFTYVTLQVLERIKGPVSSATIRLRLPGGQVGNIASWIPGTPEFAPGQEVILLARPAEGRPGVYHLSEFGLGRFDIVQDQNGQRFATRPVFRPEDDLYLSERTTSVVDSAAGNPPTPLREAEAFLASLRAEAAGDRMPEVSYAWPAGDLSASPAFSAKPEWANLGGVENGSNSLFRWFWNVGASPASPNAVVQVSGTQTNLNDSSNGTTHVTNGINQWHSGVPSTDIRISGITPGGNITVFLDATSSFDGGSAWNTALPCTQGGVIGLGGPSAIGPSQVFKGDSPYFASTSGQVSMRQLTGTAGCYSAAVFRTAVMHELGHVLGLHHPDQFTSIHSTTTSTDWNNAVMHSNVPAGTPSTPQTDDIQAMQYYYGTGGGGSPPTANFTFSPPSPTAGQLVSFTDTSTGAPTSWSWNFSDPASGGANTSTLQNPSHTFASAGSYSVSLTASNANGPSAPVMHTVVVSSASVAPTPSFFFSPGSPQPGQLVSFTDTSTGGPTSWSWNFGDPASGGGNTSSFQNPTHTFVSAGSYTVFLTAGNTFGSNQTSRLVVVSVAGTAPTAAFSFLPASPQPGQTVAFSDISSGGPTFWLWSFGDGFSSFAQNPAHVFAAAGNYTVSLTVQNFFGSSFVSHTVTVAAIPAPTAAFTFSPGVPQPGQTVSFTDTSTGGPTSWTWDFGDGSGSSSQNPSHAYLAAGTYTARLTASNASGSSQTTRTVTVRVSTPCPTDTGTLPANAGHNFCVTLAARDPRTGRTGPGLAIPQNDHFGYFSIPAITSDPINPEVFVKVLDGRPVNGFFWVFYGGLTDLEYTITVLDFQTGRTRQYTKPAGSALGGFDVLAFSGVGSVLASPEAVPAQAPGKPAARVSPAGQAGCSADIATLCLDSARGFTVTLFARDQRTGRTGAGQAIPQNDLFGYFSIPALTSDPTNPEVFVKVLDGRVINGRFWVFYGGLTDLEYTITVRDTLTGQVRSYFKSGGSAEGGFDVLAF